MEIIKRTLMVLVLLTYIGNAKAFWFSVPKKTESIYKIGEASNVKLNSEQIKILVWNIYKGKNKSWEEDFNSLNDQADLLILQEGLLNNKMTKVLESASDKSFYMGTSFIYKKNNLRTGVITGATVKPNRVYSKRSKNVEWIGLTPKALLFTEYPLTSSEKTLLVINIHAVNLVPTRSLARQIRQAGRKIKKHKGPVIFAGDFNVWNKNKIWI